MLYRKLKIGVFFKTKGACSSTTIARQLVAPPCVRVHCMYMSICVRVRQHMYKYISVFIIPSHVCLPGLYGARTTSACLHHIFNYVRVVLFIPVIH